MFNTFFSKSGKCVAMVLPLSLRAADGSWWMFPIEPLISVTGKNTIVKRNVAKSELRGTIKERWTEDDVKIIIEGKLEYKDDLQIYPSQYVAELHNIITQRNAIEVKNELLQLLNINQIVIETYSFPFSKGENIQNFSLEAYSDDLGDIFMSTENV